MAGLIALPQVGAHRIVGQMKHSSQLSAVEYAEAVLRLPPPAERRRIRRDAGVSQAHMARGLGVSTTAVALWESGTRRPGHRLIAAYAELLQRLAAIPRGQGDDD